MKEREDGCDPLKAAVERTKRVVYKIRKVISSMS